MARLDIVWPDEAEPGDVIIAQDGERRHVRRIIPDHVLRRSHARIEFYVNGHETPQQFNYDLTRMVRIEKGR